MRRLFLITTLISALAFVLPAEDNKKLTAEEIDQYVKAGKYFLLDVRTDEELQQFGSVKGYHHIPLPDLEKRYMEIPKTAEVVTMCERGRRALRVHLGPDVAAGLKALQAAVAKTV